MATVVNGVSLLAKSEPQGAPRIVEQLHGLTEAEEGDPIHLEASLAPASDNSLQIQWYKDGQPLSAGSRFNTAYDRGFVALDILYTFPEDSGEYCFVATSKFGQCQSSPILVRIAAEEVIPQSHQPQQESVLDTVARSMKADREDRHMPKEGPKFISSPPGQVQINEGQPVHAEVRVTPSNDSTMHLEWFKDGTPLTSGSRFNISSDRGICYLDIAHSIAEDSGSYICVAKNALGEAHSEPMALTCIGGASIVTESHLSENSEGYKRLKEMEEVLQQGDKDFVHLEYEEAPSAPKFDVVPISIYAGEGGPAKFLVRISGFPTPTLQWFINDEPVVIDPNHKVYNDGAINCLEIHRCELLGESNVRVIAINPLGQTEASAKLTVVPMEDFRPDLKHIKPENPYKKMMTLKKVQVTEELQNKLKMPKVSAETILTMEKEGNMRHQTFKKADVVETEELYDRVASSLRKFEPGQGYVKQ